MSDIPTTLRVRIKALYQEEVERAVAVEHQLVDAVMSTGVGMLDCSSITINHYDIFFSGPNAQHIKAIARPLLDAAGVDWEISFEGAGV